MELKSFCLVLVLGFMASIMPCHAGELSRDKREAEKGLALEETGMPQHQYLETKDVPADWTQISGGQLKHLSIGRAGVWCVSLSRSNVYYRSGTYFNEKSSGDTSWIKVIGTLAQLDVGYNVIWGVSGNGKIWYRDGIHADEPLGTSWVQVPGRLSHVSVSQKGHVWGVQSDGDIFHRVGANNDNKAGDSWRQIHGLLKQISVGESGVWGVDSDNDIWYRYGTYGDPCSDPDGWNWAPVLGKLKYISSADMIYGSNAADEIFYREGVSADTPTGTTWHCVPGSLTMVESLSFSVWGLSADGIAYMKETD